MVWVGGCAAYQALLCAGASAIPCNHSPLNWLQSASDSPKLVLILEDVESFASDVLTDLIYVLTEGVLRSHSLSLLLSSRALVRLWANECAVVYAVICRSFWCWV
jgi:hypothetical protein